MTLVTATLMVQEPLTGIVPPDRPIEAEPAFAVNVTPQEPVRLFGEATTMPAGRLSVNETPESAIVFADGLDAVKVRVEAPFGAINVGAKVSASDGGPMTVRLADAVPPVPPAVELTVPVVLFFAPAVVPVTFTENVQKLLAAIVPPKRLMLPEPAPAVIVPVPHVPA